MNIPQRRKLEWSVIILILPLGVVMMMCVGQLAIRMAPTWTVNGEMNSSIDPESAPKESALVVPPISSDILTPVSWWDTFLTPSADSDGSFVFPPFIKFEPSASPTVTASVSPTESPTIAVTRTPTVTATTPSVTVTGTKKATNTPTPTYTYTPTLTPTNTLSPTPTYTYTPTLTPTDTPSPTPSYTPTPSPTPSICTDTSANNNGGPLPCIYPVVSTPAGSQVSVPGNVNVGAPNGSVSSPASGTYFVINLGGTPVIVNGPSDTAYDLVYYEWLNPSPTINLDSVIVGISTDPNGASFYVVFNWGDNIVDTNTNINMGNLPATPAGCTDVECDNQTINTSNLTPTPPSPGGILIDVDNASSAPPTGSYQYLVIQAPVGDDDGGLDIDSVQVIEVPPVPTP